MKRALLLVLIQLAVGGCGGKVAPQSGTSAPTASFTLSPAAPAASQLVQFTDASSNGPTSWSWSFGDGGTSAVQNPTHAYAAAGTFSVTLTASNAGGSNSVTRAVVVAAQDSSLNVVLGRPTATSMVASVRAEQDADVYLEYGIVSGSYTGQTPHVTGAGGTPRFIAMTGLEADRQYYYRARYRPRSDTSYRASAERLFHTGRPSGSSFTFVIQADPHLDVNSSTAVYTQTLLNELADRPDFMFDLGDTSMAEKCAVDGSTLCANPSPRSADTVWGRYALVRSYFDLACHSIPLFMVLGNHDAETGWDSTTDAWAVATRTAFFANPEPDGFYSGSSDASPGGGLRQNYYAFEWGDALFVALDPYTYTSPKPGQNGWGWTLGASQYQWLARTVSGSRARFKFLFSHHLVGGNGTDARGGAAFAPYFEWGGRNADGTWAFDTQRPGWGVPIHQLMVDNHVTAWFHGHDHFYAREELDGVIYQEVPQPSQSRYDNPDPGAGYGYLGAVGVNQFPSSGHLRVTVTPSEVRVEYVRSVAPADETATRKNGTIVTSYVIR